MKRVVSGVRTVAAWVVIPAFISFVVAENELTSRFPGGPRPSSLPRPLTLERLLGWRNTSCELALATGLVSPPRWQSLVGLVLMVPAMFISVSGY